MSAPVATRSDELDGVEANGGQLAGASVVANGRLRRLPPPPVVRAPDTRPTPAVGDAPAEATPPPVVLAAVEVPVATPVPGRVRRLLVCRAVVAVNLDTGGAVFSAGRPRLHSVALPRTAPTPRAVLGLLWAVVLAVGMAAGPIVLALIAAPVAFVATASGLRFGHDGSRDATPSTAPLVGANVRLWIAGATALVPLAALGGPVVALVFAAGAAGLVVHLSGREGYALRPTLVLALAPTLAAGSLVLARREEGLTVASVLVVATLLYDTASCLMGNGTRGGRAGLLAGLATMFLLGFLVSATCDPPFGGVSPWVLCLLVGLLATVGTQIINRFVNPGRAPALRRLDSLALAGPLWVLVVLVGFH